MADHDLERTQRNDVLLAIRDSGLNPEDFEWHETETVVNQIGLGRAPYMVEALFHLPTGYGFCFDIDIRRGHHYAVYRPGPQGPSFQINAGDWRNEVGYVLEWLENVRREFEAPDLWAELRNQRELEAAPTPGGGEDNSPFTEPERELIAQQLGELKELITHTHELQIEQVRELNARIDYLVDASARLGRFDWRQILLSQLVSLVLASVIPQDAFATAVHFITRGFGHLFGGGDYELPGGPPELL